MEEKITQVFKTRFIIEECSQFGVVLIAEVSSIFSDDSVLPEGVEQVDSSFWDICLHFWALV